MALSFCYRSIGNGHMHMWNVKDLEVELCVTKNVRILKGNLRERLTVKNLMRKLPITKHVYIGNQIEN